MKKIDSLVEVSIALFRKGFSYDRSWLEDCCWLGSDWDSRCSEKPSNFGTVVVPNEDMFAFYFEPISCEWQEGLVDLVEDKGYDVVMAEFRENLRSLFGENPRDGESIITAWHYWEEGEPLDEKRGVELLGRVKTESIETTMEPIANE